CRWKEELSEVGEFLTVIIRPVKPLPEMLDEEEEVESEPSQSSCPAYDELLEVM
ncbi:hypothetical protein M9458_052464, partial [Cirrhinus mrigala]